MRLDYATNDRVEVYVARPRHRVADVPIDCPSCGATHKVIVPPTSDGFGVPCACGTSIDIVHERRRGEPSGDTEQTTLTTDGGGG